MHHARAFINANEFKLTSVCNLLLVTFFLLQIIILLLSVKSYYLHLMKREGGCDKFPFGACMHTPFNFGLSFIGFELGYGWQGERDGVGELWM